MTPQNAAGCLSIGIALVEVFTVIGSFAPEYDASKEEFDEATIKVYCGKQVKDQLVGPD